jgi:glycosyltransferase involved in cell wall biosynthesis
MTQHSKSVSRKPAGASEDASGIIRAAMPIHLSTSPADPVATQTLAVLPAFNEGASIQGVIVAVQQQGIRDVLVVSDSSTDDTVARARAAGAEVMELPLRCGAWLATQAGLRWAQRKGYRYVCTLDADGQHQPEHLPAMLTAARQDGVDMVIGVYPERLSWARRGATRWFRVLTGLKLEDVTSGMRIYGQRAIEQAASAQASLLDYQDLGVLLLLRRAGLGIAEVPAPMHPRGVGKSHVFSSWWKVGGYLLQTTVLCLAWPMLKQRATSGRP